MDEKIKKQFTATIRLRIFKNLILKKMGKFKFIFMNTSMRDAYKCRVCGLLYNEQTWGTFKFEICACCGTQFGYEDCGLEKNRERRADWIAKGGQWEYMPAMPKRWKLEKQLSEIPHQYQ